MRNWIIEEDLRYITKANLPWKDFADKKVLITGANGSIASYLAETLMYLNEIKHYQIMVICLVRDKHKAWRRFYHLKNRKDILFWEQDVCEPIHRKVNVDYVIHAASYASPAKYGTDPVGTLLPNVLGTYNLLEFSRRHPLKCFLFISSGEVYGEPDRSTRLRETYHGNVDPVSLRSCYSESKRMGENMCISWRHQYSVPTKIVRLFHTYGPGMRLGDGRVYSDFVFNVVHNQNLLMKSDGSAVRPFCYMSDAVMGIYTVLLKGALGDVYNVGNDKTISIKHLAQMLISLYPQKKLKIITSLRKRGKTYLPSRTQNQRPDVAKIKKLGWRPTVNLEEGFRRTIDSYGI